MNAEQYIPIIIEKLKKANPYKIILFGSYAYGKPNKDSDLDIMVVTSDNYYPQNYSEKSKLILKTTRLISNEKAEFPIDLIIYTLPMYEYFIRTGSMFAKEIQQKGIVLYERNSANGKPNIYGVNNNIEMAKHIF